MEDIDFKEQLVRVRGKGKKERLVPVGEPALKAIQAYWAQLLEPPAGAAAGVSRGHEQGRAAVAAAIVAPAENIIWSSPGWIPT